MSSPKGERKSRSISLSEEGLSLLTQVLADRIAPSKPTYERMAAEIELSLATTKKLFKGQLVDRATAVSAFQAVGLQWQEAYRVQDRIEDPTPTAPPIPSEPPRRPKLGFAYFIVGAFSLVACLFGWAWTYRTSRDPKVIKPVSDDVLERAFADIDRVYQRGDMPAAKTAALRSIDLCRKALHPRFLAHSVRYLGDIERELGNDEVAVRHYSEAIRLHEQFDARANLAYCYINKGEAEVKLARWSDAKASLAEAQALYEADGDRGGIAAIELNLGELLHRKGDLAGAVRELDRAEKSARVAHREDLAAAIAGSRGEVLCEIGELDRSLVDLTASYEYWRATSLSRWIARCQLRLGMLHAKRGDLQRAASCFKESEERYAGLHDAPGLQRVQSEAGRLAKSRVSSGPIVANRR